MKWLKAKLREGGAAAYVARSGGYVAAATLVDGQPVIEWLPLEQAAARLETVRVDGAQVPAPAGVARALTARAGKPPAAERPPTAVERDVARQAVALGIRIDVPDPEPGPPAAAPSSPAKEPIVPPERRPPPLPAVALRAREGYRAVACETCGAMQEEVTCVFCRTGRQPNAGELGRPLTAVEAGRLGQQKQSELLAAGVAFHDGCPGGVGIPGTKLVNRLRSPAGREYHACQSCGANEAYGDEVALSPADSPRSAAAEQL